MVARGASEPELPAAGPSGQPAIETVDQLHPPLEEFAVRHPLRSPALQDALDGDAFVAPESSIAEIGVVDDLRDGVHSRVLDREPRPQRLEGAVLSTMAEALEGLLG